MFAAKNMLLTRHKAGSGTVAFDATGSGSAGLTSAGTATTWSHTVATAGATIYADFTLDRAATLSSVTCAGNPMTLVDTVNLTGGASGNAFISRYKYVGAAPGANTISITPSVAGWAVWGSVSYTGVTSLGATQSATGTGATASQSTTCGAGQMILQAFAGHYNGTNLASAGTPSGGTNRYKNLGGFYEALTISDAAVSTTFGWSLTNMGFWAGMAHALIP